MSATRSESRAGRCMRWALLTATVLLGLGHPASAGKIGFIEEFALADDRADVLSLLIPGTEDYYYFHCLNHQHQQQFDEVNELLVKWVERHGETNRVREIRNRQALLTYDTSPRATLAYLREYLNLRFNHQRRSIDRNKSLPTSLAAERISATRLRDAALRSRKKDLLRFTNAALAWLSDQRLTNEQRRELLSRLTQPDLPNLVNLVHEDLGVDRRIRFGGHKIHVQMLRAQLDALLKLRPTLANEQKFVQAYVQKLAAPAGVDINDDVDEKQAYLDRVWDFASQLPATQNSLRANVLYHQLKLDIERGEFSRDRLLTYLAIPRRGTTVESRYNSLPKHRNSYAQLEASYTTELPPIGNDRELIRVYLTELFAKEKSYRRYLEYLDEDYVKHLFAEAKILNGLGNSEEWSSLLTPQQYQQLRERVELRFSETNTKHFSSDDEIAFDVEIKNIPTLIVKVYRINATSYYQDNNRHVNTAINLDGLVANQEDTYEYKRSPFRRARERFTFPELTTPGIYVIDFIGGSTSSRVLVHKGSLRHVVQQTPLGHLFTVLDENQQQLSDARIWMGGKIYESNKDGQILLPYSTNPQTTSIVLLHKELASHAKFRHRAESHTLDVGFHVDREQLRSRQLAPLTIRAGLRLNGQPISVNKLDEVTLKITAVDHDGIPTSTVIDNIELSDNQDFVHDFRVPDRLQRLKLQLTAKVIPLSHSKPQSLVAVKELSLNGIDATAATGDVHLSKTPGGYILETLGKSGEPIRQRPVQLELTHEWFKNKINVVLRSDDLGRIDLGALEQIKSIKATPVGSGAPGQTWGLENSDRFTQSRYLTAQVGELLEIPYPGNAPLKRAEVSLLETRGKTYAKDYFGLLKRVPGAIHVAGLPRGGYRLRLKNANESVSIEVRDATPINSFLVDPHGALSTSINRPMHIRSVKLEGNKAVIQLANANSHSRVHLYATNFQPQFNPYEWLRPASLRSPTRLRQPRLKSFYVQGRKIGDEFRYILERRHATKFPGNMLTRPELLLNPWDVRDTSTDEQSLAEGSDFDSEAQPDAAAASRATDDKSKSMALTGFANLDFLANGSVVELNLRPDKNGRLEVDLTELGGERMLHVIALDRFHAAQQAITLPNSPRMSLDLRMAKGLDANMHYALEKRISLHNAGELLEIGNTGSGKFQIYDSIDSVYDLFQTLLPNSELAKFGFITRWPKMSDDEKREVYSEFACHELNFFLSKKDPEFFDRVVQPHLGNKLHKTFMDHYLLGNDLTGYLSPWSHEQLNVVETILLAQRIEGEMEYTLPRLRNRLELTPQDISQLNVLFGTAIRGQALSQQSERYSIRLQANTWAAPAPTASAAIAGGGMPGLAGARPSRALGRRRMAVETEEDAVSMDDAMADGAVAFDFRREDRATSESLMLYRQLDKTKEWAENNYYRLLIEQQDANLVVVNKFWADWADRGQEGEFRSEHFIGAARNFTEAMLTLAVLDLPAVSPEHQIDVVNQKIRITPSSPLIVLHEQVDEAKTSDEPSPVLISQNFFKHDERHEMRNGQQVDKLVSGEFLYQTVYGCRLVITNPTSTRQVLDVLMQLPEGAIPVSKAKRTETRRIALEPYRTENIEFLFYFPEPGEFAHYPAHVTQDSTLVAAADVATFKVVEQLTKVDRDSWNYVSQEADDTTVLEYLKSKNLQNIDLGMIAFRMGDIEFFQQATDILRRRHAYNHLLWTYSVQHNDVNAMGEYLAHEPRLAGGSGPVIDSPILRVDPVERKTFQHLEYHPLVNARTHALGETREILNDRFYAQYNRWLGLLAYLDNVDDQNRLVTTYYLLLQDRIEEAVAQFKQISPANVHSRLQYDYCKAYLSMSLEDTQTARAVATQYESYPVDRWRNAFALVRSHLDEIEGKGSFAVDPSDVTQTQSERAAGEPAFDFTVEGRTIKLSHLNLSEVQVRYYLMDIELLFSRNPFVQQHQGQFAYIAPNQVESLQFESDAGEFTHVLPDALQRQNVLIEVVGAGNRVSKPYYSNGLTVQTFDRFGQLRVVDAEQQAPQAKVYCKVYAKNRDGSVTFYKDGYTDLRGRFDYATLSTNSLDRVERFAILILSDDQGALVREVAPPKQ